MAEVLLLTEPWSIFSDLEHEAVTTNEKSNLIEIVQTNSEDNDIDKQYLRLRNAGDAKFSYLLCLNETFFIWIRVKISQAQFQTNELSFRINDQQYKRWHIKRSVAECGEWHWQRYPTRLTSNGRDRITFTLHHPNVCISSIFCSRIGSPPSLVPKLSPPRYALGGPIQTRKDPQRPWKAFRVADDPNVREECKNFRKYVLGRQKTTKLLQYSQSEPLFQRINDSTAMHLVLPKNIATTEEEEEESKEMDTSVQVNPPLDENELFEFTDANQNDNLNLQFCKMVRGGRFQDAEDLRLKKEAELSGSEAIDSLLSLRNKLYEDCSNHTGYQRFWQTACVLGDEYFGSTDTPNET